MAPSERPDHRGEGDGVEQEDAAGPDHGNQQAADRGTDGPRNVHRGAVEGDGGTELILAIAAPLRETAARS